MNLPQVQEVYKPEYPSLVLQFSLHLCESGGRFHGEGDWYRLQYSYRQRSLAVLQLLKTLSISTLVRQTVYETGLQVFIAMFLNSQRH